MTTTPHDFQIGDFVTYEDRANPLRTFEIVDHDPATDTYELLDAHKCAAAIYSDCRQRGWRLADAVDRIAGEDPAKRAAVLAALPADPFDGLV